MTTPSIIFVRGLPGSGKSSFAQLLSKTIKNLEWVENDHFRTGENGEYLYHKDDYQEVRTKVRNVIGHVLEREKESIVVSNVFTTANSMNALTPPGTPTLVFHLTSQFRGVHNVPPAHVVDMKERWEGVKGEYRFHMDEITMEQITDIINNPDNYRTEALEATKDPKNDW